MTIDDVRKYYGSLYKAIKATGLSHQTIYGIWKKNGYISITQQLLIEKITNGDLKASLDDIVK